MGTRLEALRRQHTEISDGVSAIEDKAQHEKRDLTDIEQADVDKLYERAETLLPEIEAAAKKQGSMDSAAAVLARIGPATSHQRSAPAKADEVEPLTVGEFMSLHIRAQRDGDEEAVAELLLRAPATQTTADSPGNLPIPIVGPIIKLADPIRPVWNSLTSRPMPASGKKFTRPRIVQRVLIAEQMAELDELATRKMTTTADEVTKRTFGGVLELSEQEIDWTDPAAMQLLIQDFVDTYAEVTEVVATTALVALAVPTSLWNPASIATMISSITTGFQVVYTAAKRMPNTMWLSLDQALLLAGTVNPTTDVSAMTLIRQALSDAGIPINFVTAPLLPAGTRILGASSLVESYENVKGLIQAPDVSKLGVVMAYRGYAATYGLAAGFVGLDAA